MQDSKLGTGSEKDITGDGEYSFGSQKSKGAVKSADLNGSGSSSWTDREESALLEALKTHKWADWEGIQSEIKTKSIAQLKSKITNLQVHKLSSKASQVKKDILEIILKNKKITSKKSEINSSDEEIVEKDELRGKSTSAKTVASKSPAKSPASKSPVKKRSYNRGKSASKKNSNEIISVNSGEDVSIVSSSSSDKDGINIMSSSSSSHSLSGSISSTKSKSSDKSRKFSNNSSSESLSSFSSSGSKISDSEIPIWVKEACPAIFASKALNDPLKTFKKLKVNMIGVLSENPEFTAEDLKKHKLLSKASLKSLNQMLDVINRGGDKGAAVGVNRESPTNITSKLNKKDGTSVKKGKASENISVDEQIAEDYELLKKLSSTSSGRKRKIRSEEGDWIDPNEIEGRVISHEPVNSVAGGKEKRKRKSVRKEFFSEDGVLSSSEDPFRLIYLNDFKTGRGSDKDGEDDGIQAPFRVQICRSVLLLMDLHSHLHSSEIIGLLGGVFVKGELVDGSDSVLRIDFGYPCLTMHSTGTQVDVDPLSEMEAGEFFESKSVRMAGWYHSHPNFEPNPSLRDLETQTMYQNLFKDSLPGSDVEPFVGLIVNPYLALTEGSSHIECFHVLPNAEIPSQERLPYRLSIEAVAFDPARFPQLLESMREIVLRAQEAPDRLNMLRNAEPGIKRIDKLFNSLKYHGELKDEHLQQIKNLFEHQDDEMREE